MISISSLAGPVLLPTLYLFILCMQAITINGFQPGDRLSAFAQTMHGSFQSAWQDLKLDQMPQFGVDNSFVFRAVTPNQKSKIDTYKDFKLTLSFDRHRLVLPWIVLYDSEARRSVRKLVVTFIHDEFEVVSIKHEIVCEDFNVSYLLLTILSNYAILSFI